MVERHAAIELQRSAVKQHCFALLIFGARLAHLAYLLAFGRVSPRIIQPTLMQERRQNVNLSFDSHPLTAYD